MKTLFPVVNFLKCVVAEVVLLSIVAFKTLGISQFSHFTLSRTFSHLRCGGISITNFLLILTAK